MGGSAVAVEVVDGPRAARGAAGEACAGALDALGTASARAQGLRAAISSWRRLAQSGDTAFLARAADGEYVGLLRAGRRTLFVHDATGRMRKVEPLCVLDFFVLPAHQRAGVGKALFDAMLAREALPPGQLAVDRPSEKSRRFLAKHYGLSAGVMQTNNFMTFPELVLEPRGAGCGPQGAPRRGGPHRQPHHHQSQDVRVEYASI